MNKVKLSIIIPVYNVEKYIGDCLRSIFSVQNRGVSFEVIIVDDETPDNSMSIVNEFACLVPNLFILHQRNQGQGVARNFGMSIAKGEYIWFIDSDDWIDENAIGTLFEYFEKYPEIDLFVTPALWIYPDRSRNWIDLQYPEDRRMSGKDYLESRLQLAAWQFIVRRTLIAENQISYFPGILHEDGLWGFQIMYVAKSVMILTSPLYCYRQREDGSVMHNLTIRSAYDLLTIHKQKMLFMDGKVSPEDRVWYVKLSMESFEKCVDIVWHLRNTLEFKQFLQNTKEYRYREIDKCFSLGGIKWKLKCWLFKHPILNKWRRLLQQRIKSWIS